MNETNFTFTAESDPPVAYCHSGMVMLPAQVALDPKGFAQRREEFPIRIGGRSHDAFMRSVSQNGAMTVAFAFCKIAPCRDYSQLIEQIRKPVDDDASIAERDRVEEKLRQSLKIDPAAPKGLEAQSMWAVYWSEELPLAERDL